MYKALHQSANAATFPSFSNFSYASSAIPNNLQLASDCVLFSPNNEQKRLHCKGYELPSDEILTLISQGLIVSEVSMIWNERIQFTLTHDFVLKRVKCLDYLLDEFNEARTLEDEEQQRDASLMLLAGELRSLLKDVFTSIVATEPA